MTIESSSRSNFHRFPDPDALAHALARAVATDLRHAITARGHATLAVSGGNTPKRFLQALSQQALDWRQVTVTLVDERWVPETSVRSNAALVRTHLLQGPASAATFVPLYRDTPEPEAALVDLERDLAALPLPLDVVVLGMGDDGHTASFFPAGDRLAEALDPAGIARVLPMRAAAANEPRITLTLPLLLATGSRYLHIEGHGKREILEQALTSSDATGGAPIAHVLRRAAPIETYWSA